MIRILTILVLLCAAASATVYTPTAARIIATSTVTAPCTGTATLASTTLTSTAGCFASGMVNEGILFNGNVCTITAFTSSTIVTVSGAPCAAATAQSYTVLSSACYSPSSCNGWVLEIDVPTIATGGTFGNFGFSQSTNNVPSSPSVILTVTSHGYQGTVNGGTCGTTTTYTRTVYATHTLREPYPNPGTTDNISVAGTTTFRLALSDRIYSTDTVTYQVANSFYTDGSSNTVGTVAGGTSVTNNSTLAYSYARAIFNWTYPGWQRVTGATFTVRGTGFAQYPMNSLPLACVVYTATDQHSHTATATVGFPTIDPTLGDQAPVIEYLGSISTSTFTNHDQITVTFKAYPWIGDSTATMDSSDAVYAQPTPLYAPQYYLFDSTNNYSAAAYVDGSETFPGSHTSGTFQAGEKVTQSTSNATAYLIDVTGANGAGPIHIGAVATGTTNSTNGSTWTGATSGAVFTQTGAPTPAGADTNSCAAAESGGQPATACATINGALIKMAAFNNASSTPTHNDACGTVFLNQGYYNWLGTSTSGSNTTGKCWANIVPATGVTEAQVVFQGVGIGSGATVGSQGFGSACTSGSTNCGTPLHVKGVTVNVATGPTSTFNSTTYLWLDGMSFTANGTAPVYQVTDTYITESVIPSTLGGLGLKPFSGANSSYVLLRGNDVSTVGAAGMFVYTAVGNTNKSSQNLYFETEQSGQACPASIMPILAFNTLYKASNSSNAAIGLFESTSNLIGAAIVQNIVENIYTNSSIATFTIAADSSTGTADNNIMLWDNDLVGGRNNRLYNETGTTPLFRQSASEIGNIMDTIAIKTDTFNGTPQGGRLGNWAEVYGSAFRNNLFLELTGGTTGWTATGAFCNEFIGLITYYGTVTGGATNPPTCTTQSTINYPSYKNRQAFDGTNGSSGGGDYHLNSSSPAANFFAAGTNILPYDISGQIRNNVGYGSAGAFEQAIVQTTGGVLAF